MRHRPRLAAASFLLLAACTTGADPVASPSHSPSPSTPGAPRFQEYAVPVGSGPHDVAVAADGTVWYTAQRTGKLGRLDPVSGRVTEIPLGAASHPHGVIVGSDGAPWVTDMGLNAIVRVDPATSRVRVFPMPGGRDVGPHTAVDRQGTIWFTGSSGFYGRLPLGTGTVEVFEAPRGRGPYGITAAPDGDVYYASLAGHHVVRVDPRTARATVLEPPTRNQGSRRVWVDSRGRVWCSQWDAGKVAVYDPSTGQWREWKLPGSSPQAYAVYVDDRDVVWLSDFGANALVRFEPSTERFTSFPLPSNPGNVRQIHGRPGEVWGAESAADKLVVLRL